jgi:hypothetical protein
MPLAASAQKAGGGDGDSKAPSTRAFDRCKVVLGAANVGASNGFFSTDLVNFVDIPETTINFRISGTANRCVLVVFSAEAYAFDTRLMWVRALLDGSPGAPVDAQFASGDGNFRFVHAAQFIFENVTPGRHRIQMQYRSRIAGQEVFIANPVTTVYNSD